MWMSRAYAKLPFTKSIHQRLAFHGAMEDAASFVVFSKLLLGPIVLFDELCPVHASEKHLLNDFPFYWEKIKAKLDDLNFTQSAT